MWSLINWYFTSMWLLRSFCMLSRDRERAPWLSAPTITGVSEHPRLTSTLRRHRASRTANESAMYTTSTVDWAMTLFFLLRHEITPPPNKKQCPLVDFRLPTLPAKSESEYPCSEVVSLPLFSPFSIPSFLVPPRYLKTCFTSFQWAAPGSAINLEREPAANAMSGRVMLARCKIQPTNNYRTT